MLISSSIVAPYLKYYREELGVEFLKPILEKGPFDICTKSIHSEFLKIFPACLTQPDILDSLKFLFNSYKEGLKRDERNNNEKLRNEFVKLFKEVCYPLLNLADIPAFDLSDHEAMEIRAQTIMRLSKLVRKGKLLEFLLDGSENFTPFNIEELRYNILG